MLRQVFPCCVYILCVMFFSVLLSNLPWCHWRWQGQCPFPVPKPSNECPFPWPSCQLPDCPTPRLCPSRPLNAARARRALDSVSASASDCGLAFGPTCSPCPAIINHDVSALTHLSDRQPRRPLRRRLRTVPIVWLCPCNENVFEKALRLTSASTRCCRDADVEVDGRQSTGAQRAVGRHV